MTPEALMQRAQDARAHAYAPYSGFAVGAALLCADGTVYCGCNIENAAFSPTNCAERTAVFSAVAAGQLDFSQIAICGGADNAPATALCAPCGVCRQVLYEFCDPDTFLVHHMDGATLVTHTLGALLPLGFSKTALPT